MELQYKQSYLSVSQFNPVKLSPFSILTGVNGSGKSHLLTAIEQQKVVIAGMEGAHIVKFNYETFRLENEGASNAQSISSERESAWKYFNQQIKGNISSWKNNIGDEYNSARNTCKEEKKSLWKLKGNQFPKLNQYKKNIADFFNNPNTKNNQQAQTIYPLIKNLDHSIDELSHDEFLKLHKPFNFKNDFLPQQLGKIIFDYYTKHQRNEFNIFQNVKNGKSFPTVSEEEFTKTHGRKPWEILNEILNEFDTLDYKVNSPEGQDYFGSFQLKLVHKSKNGLEIDFNSLSSGERILMALVAAVYKASTDNHFPDVLLLDEVDASLHPSMMKNMLDVIKKIFLDRDIKVILVSHSPTTIALAPDESIFIMHKSGLNRIEKKTKQEALSILTEGYATLDQGIRLFDQVSRKKISIITEGDNVQLIQRACKIYQCSDIEIITGVEGKSGKSQLKTLFDFFSRASHTNKVIFIWDCDANSYRTLQADNNTYPYVFEKTRKTLSQKRVLKIYFPRIYLAIFLKKLAFPKEKK